MDAVGAPTPHPGTHDGHDGATFTDRTKVAIFNVINSVVGEHGALAATIGGCASLYQDIYSYIC